MNAASNEIAESPFLAEDGGAPYFETGARRAARERLAALAGTGARLALLTAEAGAGKTALLGRAARDFDPAWTVCRLDGRDATRAREVLGALLRTLGEHDFDVPVGVQINRLGVRLASQPRRTLLVVDDAQRLQADVLGVLMALASKPGTAPRLSIVLVGRPVLLARIASVATAWESETSIELVELPPLDRDAVADYVHLRVHGAGGRGDSPFGEGVVDWLAEASRGHPGWIDSLAAHALHQSEEAARRSRRRNRRRKTAVWWLASGIAASAASMAFASGPSRDTALDAVWRSVEPALETARMSEFQSSILLIE